MRTVFSVFMTVAWVLPCAAQTNTDCTTAATLCAQQPVASNNTGSTGTQTFCPGNSAALWYAFTTNAVGGPVIATLSAIDCPSVPDMDDELGVVIVSGNINCQPGSLSAVSPCVLGAATASTTTANLLPNTRYWVVVSGGLGGGATIAAQCAFQLQVQGPGVNVVGITFGAGDDVTIGEGESTQLAGFGGPPYTWSPSTGLSATNIPDPIASPLATTIYTLTTTTPNGCVYSDQVVVEVVRRIQPPNTFTPNGDGFNDLWEIPGIQDYPGSEVRIHDRWGQLVFRSNGYREPWDGTNGGRMLPDGTYYYHIRLNVPEGRAQVYTGYISIVR
jgi:gliding motility-associated-like protein